MVYEVGASVQDAVPVEDRCVWSEGEGVWDETLERSAGGKHAAGACGQTLPGLKEEGWGTYKCVQK